MPMIVIINPHRRRRFLKVRFRGTQQSAGVGGILMTSADLASKKSAWEGPAIDKAISATTLSPVSEPDPELEGPLTQPLLM